jgi:pilus assembly protein CpaB
MSRNAVAIAPPRSNRRFVVLAIGLGLLGAILLYAVAARGSSAPASTPGTTPVVVAKAPIPARTKITLAMVELRRVAPADANSLGYSDATPVVGQVTRFPIAANEQVLSNKLVNLDVPSLATAKSLSFVVPQGKRGIAITISKVQAAGGLILPGDYVDVLAVYENLIVQTELKNVLVLAVSDAVVDTVPDNSPAAQTNASQTPRNSEAKPIPDAETITLSLTPEEAEHVYLAESVGKIRLSVRGYGDADTPPVGPIMVPDLFPRNLPSPFLK